jgi:hypothetical protein
MMVNPWSSLVRDFRYSLRALRKTPAFTVSAVTTVALTVGATTAIFSVVYGVLLRQLPYRHVERLFWIWSDQPGRDRTPFDVPDFIDYRDSTRTLSGFAGYFAYRANLNDEAAAERVQGPSSSGRQSLMAAASCDDVVFRKKPLRSVSRSQAEVAAIRSAFLALEGTFSGTIVGTAPVP